MAMTFAEFHNGIRLLHSIDAHELGDPSWADDFICDPVDFFIHADDATADVIWQAMVKRGAVKTGTVLTLQASGGDEAA